jgi:hypothetical protein
MLRSVSDSPHLMAALQGVVKSKEGMSNSELDELLADNSNWMTLWVVRQLLALGFIEYGVDLFGGPAKYAASDLGRNVLSAITGQPAPQTQPAPPPPQARPAVASAQPQPTPGTTVKPAPAAKA